MVRSDARTAALGAWLLLGPVLLAALAAPATASHVCDPYPVGRCGNFQREEVVFCYAANSPTERFIFYEATDANVVTLGTAVPPNRVPPDPTLVSTEGVRMGQLYVRKAPAETVLADPYEAPLPAGTLYRETNFVPGLQTKEFRCAILQWWAECEPAAWMGPFQERIVAPDEKIY